MKVTLLGAGHIGYTISQLLHASGDYQVTVADRDERALAAIAALGVQTRTLDTADASALAAALDDQDVVLNALPYHLAIPVAQAAKATNTHYFDLTEDVKATKTIRQLAEGASNAFMPQCGLAPGFIGIAAHSLAKRFDSVREVKMRVGALPEFPTNALKYNLTWSVDGLVNEYCHPCEAVRNGELQLVQPLEGLEHFSLDGVEYEAFNTSGGLGTLCETLQGQVETLDYKTVRYPGHRDLMKFLLEDLRLASDQEQLKAILRGAVPTTMQDVVLVFVTVSGMRGGKLVQEVFSRKIFAAERDGRLTSAIQITTAAGICTALDLFREGKLPQRGFIAQEQVDMDAFLANRFGKAYQPV
ncbi:saccharopine dehydrogenase NADP-binding domain-containing protein [Pseudomonas oryzihabitans]|uniref:saccharopine dehydrogenase family protein n=1 Tax=Pseudomonas oryzihabitans TaxID=47885 RepID=UPI001F5291A1|nr:saccharopine dehydrogenase C-terminal domain-containing protein [Pseudomonas oryzihabitans]MCI1008679.1 saccharopine dehydrogenase NADP-binding domain-containing protein [Pseudomonas oryzihabitans]